MTDRAKEEKPPDAHHRAGQKLKLGKVGDPKSEVEASIRRKLIEDAPFAGYPGAESGSALPIRHSLLPPRELVTMPG